MTDAIRHADLSYPVAAKNLAQPCYPKQRPTHDRRNLDHAFKRPCLAAFAAARRLST